MCIYIQVDGQQVVDVYMYIYMYSGRRSAGPGCIYIQVDGQQVLDVYIYIQVDGQQVVDVYIYNFR